MEERIQCTVSGKVRYSVKPELLVTLPVPMAMATNHGNHSCFRAVVYKYHYFIRSSSCLATEKSTIISREEENVSMYFCIR